MRSHRQPAARVSERSQPRGRRVHLVNVSGELVRLLNARATDWPAVDRELVEEVAIALLQLMVPQLEGADVDQERRRVDPRGRRVGQRSPAHRRVDAPRREQYRELARPGAGVARLSPGSVREGALVDHRATGQPVAGRKGELQL